nr:mucin-2-like [Penaeus vannamei]
MATTSCAPEIRTHPNYCPPINHQQLLSPASKPPTDLPPFDHPNILPNQPDPHNYCPNRQTPGVYCPINYHNYCPFSHHNYCPINHHSNMLPIGQPQYLSHSTPQLLPLTTTILCPYHHELCPMRHTPNYLPINHPQIATGPASTTPTYCAPSTRPQTSCDANQPRPQLTAPYNQPQTTVHQHHNYCPNQPPTTTWFPSTTTNYFPIKHHNYCPSTTTTNEPHHHPTSPINASHQRAAPIDRAAILPPIIIHKLLPIDHTTYPIAPFGTTTTTAPSATTTTAHPTTLTAPSPSNNYCLINHHNYCPINHHNYCPIDHPNYCPINHHNYCPISHHNYCQTSSAHKHPTTALPPQTTAHGSAYQNLLAPSATTTYIAPFGHPQLLGPINLAHNYCPSHVSQQLTAPISHHKLACLINHARD